MAKPDWTTISDGITDRSTDYTTDYAQYRKANARMVERVMRGAGPHTTSTPRGGMRLVYNISTAHIPSFMAKSGAAQHPAYLNRYDLMNAPGGRLGNVPPANPPGTLPLRERIDNVVAEVGWPGQADIPADIYYGALELNGAGIRYFGDACLVLRYDKVPRESLVLYRNSYDLSCDPVVDRIHVPGDESGTHKNSVAELDGWAGRWPDDVPDMVICKILEQRPDSRRRMTTGAVSEGVLADEDYIEIPKRGSFAARDVEECRLGSADAAAEARIADRARNGPLPGFAELQWRHRRRVAEAALGKGPDRVPVRVVMTVGRDRG